MAHFFMENLPHRCPPGNASIVKNRVRVYQLVKNNPPQNSDFLSAKKLQPNRRFKNDCLALGVSVWTEHLNAHQCCCCRHTEMKNFVKL